MNGLWLNWRDDIYIITCKPAEKVTKRISEQIQSIGKWVKISNTVFKKVFSNLVISSLAFSFFSKCETQHWRSVHSHRRANVYARARLKSTMAASFGVCRLRFRALGGLDKFCLGLEPQTQVRFTSTTSAIKAQTENKTAKAGNIVFL